MTRSQDAGRFAGSAAQLGVVILAWRLAGWQFAALLFVIMWLWSFGWHFALLMLQGRSS